MNNKPVEMVITYHKQKNNIGDLKNWCS